MSDDLEKTLSLRTSFGEFDISPAKYPHNSFVGKIYYRLEGKLENSSLSVLLDTFRYLEDWLINSFGDFKNFIYLEDFIAGLQRFGASERFIQSKLSEYASMGTIYPGYAPDICIVEKTGRNNEFGIPLMVFEITSKRSQENDLWFKPYFYETIGVNEYFVGEPEVETGAIIRAYRLENKRYQPIALEDDGYFSQVLGHVVPKQWEM